jgi:hypothetical protein
MLAISSRVAAPASLSSSSAAKGKKRASAGKLGFYRAFPVDKIELDQFEQYAIDRLQGKRESERASETERQNKQKRYRCRGVWVVFFCNIK